MKNKDKKLRIIDLPGSPVWSYATAKRNKKQWKYAKEKENSK